MNFEDMPIHIAGTIGEKGLTLTVVSINEEGNQITFSSELKDDKDAIKVYDVLNFEKDAFQYYAFSIIPTLSCAPASVRATEDASSDSDGNIVVNITPDLKCGVMFGCINKPIEAGMKVTVFPSHKVGFNFEAIEKATEEVVNKIIILDSCIKSRDKDLTAR
jgi:hypothetical protein